MKTIRQPRRELLEVAEVLEEVLQDFLRVRAAARPEGTWEAPLEAWSISNLMVRNIEAVVLLARHDEVMAPAAWANARNVCDAASRILWLLWPTERFEAETRWIALLQEYEDYHRRMSDLVSQAADSLNRHRSTQLAIREFREGVTAKLPSPFQVPSRIPPVRDMLRDLGIEDMYQLYIEGSQFMHAAMGATTRFRSGLGSMKEMGEFVTVHDWILPLRTCWICLHNAGKFVISRLEVGTSWDVVARLGPAVDAAFRTLALSGRPEERGEPSFS